MIEFPPYMKLIVNNQVRRAESPSRSARTERESEAASSSEVAVTQGAADTVEMTARVTSQNLAAMDTDVPTALEAEHSLQALQRDLADAGRSVEDVHSGLDRRVIISLLAPLVY